MPGTVDRDNKSTLLLAIISLKHVTAYNKLLYTALHSNCSLTIEKNTGILRSTQCLCERLSAKPALNRRLSRFFFPAD